MRELAAVEIDTYRHHGVVVLPQMLDRGTLDAIADGIAMNMASPSIWSNDYTPKDAGGRFFDDYVNWQRIDHFKTSATTGPLPRIAGQLMGTKRPRFFHEHVLVKEPGTVTPTPWHHDDPYYGVDGMDNVSLWVSLDDIPETIALRCLAGSHRLGRRFIPNRFVDDSPYVDAASGFERFPTVDELESLGDVITCPTSPGDVVAFHFRTLHSAPGTENHRHSRRVASFRYIGDDVRWVTRPWKTSPPFEPNGLTDGDELDEQRFPTIVL